MTFTLNIKPKAEVDSEALAAKKASARAKVMSLIADNEKAAMSDYTIGEIASWPDKFSAAKAYLAGTATPAQLDALNIEANITGETVDDLVNNEIIPAAEQFQVLTAKSAGWRRRYNGIVESASSIADVDNIIAQAEDEIGAA